MRLYYAPNTISIAVALCLEEAGLDYEPVKLNFRDADQSKPEYLAINSKGRVPTLESDGHRLTETGALLEYVAALAPNSALVPHDPIDAVHMRSVMYYLASTMHVNHAHRMRGHRWADRPESFEDMANKVPETMRRSAEYVDAECLRGPFVLGNSLSIADCYLFMISSWLTGDGVSYDDLPKLNTFMRAMEARDSVLKIRAAGMLT